MLAPSQHQRAKIASLHLHAKTPRYLQAAARGNPQEQAQHQQKAPVATAGCHALTPELRGIAWPRKFKPDMPPRYDGTADPAEFLQLYELCIEAANGDERVMASWLLMALKDGARTWLLAQSPPGTICALASSPTSRALATGHWP